jgi:hypothetical protein
MTWNITTVSMIIYKQALTCVLPGIIIFLLSTFIIEMSSVLPIAGAIVLAFYRAHHNALDEVFLDE